MDLNNLMERAKAGKAPAGAESDLNGSLLREAGLVAALKAADEKHRAMLRRSRRFLLVATAIFIGVFLTTWFSPGAGTAVGEVRLLMTGGLACVYVFVSILYSFRLRALSRIDHSKPVVSFLADAELRYRFMRPIDWYLIFIGLLFVGTVSGIGAIPYLSRVLHFSAPYWPMAVYFAVFILAIAAIGYFFSKKDWEKGRAPLWRQIREARQELASPE